MPAVETEAVENATLPIKDGYEDPDDVAVMAITSPSSLCTASLIAPNVLLTARHCISSTNTGTSVDCTQTKFGTVSAASRFHATSALEVTADSSQDYAVAEVIGLAGIPGVPGSVENDLPLCGNDMAILVLEENVPASDAVPYEPLLEGSLEPGLTYYAVGYGAVNGSGADAGTRRRRDDLTVTCEDEAGCEAVEVPGVVDGEWTGSGGICSGDSGGPALDASNRVFGVTSRGDAECELAVYASTTAHAQWIKDATVFAAGMGSYEPPAWTVGSTVNPEYSRPVGAACVDGSECPSGICVTDDAGGYCSRLCAVEAPCPSDYECEGEEGTICTKTAAPPPLGAFKRADKDGCGCTLAGRPVKASWLGWAMLAAAFVRRRRR